MKNILLLLASFMMLFFSISTEAQTVTIGTGTNVTTGTEASPVNCYYRNHKFHYIYEASEINAAGIFNQQWINSIAFDVVGLPNNPLPGYSVKIAQVPASTTTLSGWHPGPFTQVYSSTSQSFTTGWNTMTFATPYLWDGVSNLVVEICWSIFSTPQWSSTGTLRYTDRTNAVIWYRSDFTSACPTTLVATWPQNYYKRANAQFDFSPYLLPCTGQPDAGTLAVDPITPCINKPFKITMMNSTLATNLVYDWQSAPIANPTNFTTIPGSSTTQNYYSSTFLTPAYYRAIVTCPTNNLSDTTASIYVDSGGFYVCYCDPAFTSNAPNYFIDSVGIAGTTLAYGSSGKGPNGYTKTNHLLPNATCTLQQNVSYDITVARGTASSVAHQCGMWIDYDQSGTYDASEFTLIQYPFLGFYYTKNFTVPNNLPAGKTGMRIIYSSTALTGNACVTNLVNGEVEDYVVTIDLPPCDNPADAGVAYSIDSAVCDGVEFMLVDTAHETNKIGLTYGWQSSTDNINWTNVAGANSDTLLTNIATPTWFRFVVYCNGTPSYSNTTKVEIFPSFACYCPSRSANYGEVSDVGSVKFGNYVLMAPGGSHLRNQKSTAKYTSHLNKGIIPAEIGATYPFAAYHIQKDSTHINAKVTMFIDLDRDGQFSSAERLYSGLSTQTGYYLTSNIDIPATASAGLTGFRVIVNENTGPNSPSDDGCGIYASGETEDYLVELYEDVTGLQDANMGIEKFSLYPVPASNVLNYMLRITGNEKFDLSLTDMTGRLLYSTEIKVNGEHADALNIEELADGVYSLNIRNDQGNVLSERFTVRN